MNLNWIFVTFLYHYFTDITLMVFGEILEFQQTTSVSQASEEDNHVDNHLPLSSLFSQSDKYKCLIKGEKDFCTQDDKNYIKQKFGANFEGHYSEEYDENKFSAKKIYFGPRYQPVHLALPRREARKPGHEETLSVNGRTMKIKTLSQLPFIFEVTNFLSENETELVIDMATSKKMVARTARQAHVYLQEEIDQRLFDRWDLDYDGFVSEDELRNLQEFDSLLLSTEDIKDLLRTVDTDSDGSLSYGELSKGGLNRMKQLLHEREKKRSKNRSFGAKETWLWHDEDELLMYEGLFEHFHERISSITDIPEDIIERSEPIQVSKQENNSFTACHQDSDPTDNQKPCCAYGSIDCRICRYLSIHMFLNDEHNGGELVFPIADNETFTWQQLNRDMLQKCEKKPNTEKSNIVVKPTRGSAVFWYNHEVNPYTGWMGQLEARAISALSPVVKNETESAWNAKMWVNIIGDGVHMLKPWRLGSNWLKEPNKKTEIIERMRNDFYREGELYLHRHRKTYRKQYDFEREQKFQEQMQHQQQEQQQQQQQDKNDLKTILSEEIDARGASSDLRNKTLPATKTTTNKQQNETLQHMVNATKTFDLRPNVNTPEPNNKSHESVENKFKNTKPSEHNRLNLQSNTADKVETDSSISSVEKNTKPIGPSSSIPVLGFHNKKKQPGVPLGPPKRPLDPETFQRNKVIENGLVKASLLLLEELERDELEIIARSIHDKLQLACIPLIVNPIR